MDYLNICYGNVAAGLASWMKGAAPLGNLSVWEPRFGGFIRGWGPGWYHQGPVQGHGSISYRSISLARPKS